MVISFHQIVDDAVGVFMALSGEMEIDHCRVEAAMAQVLLNTPDIDAGLEQVGGIAVAQGVDRDAFFDFELFEHPAQGALHGSFCHGFLGCGAFFAASAQSGKDPHGVAVQLPVLSQGLERCFGQGNISIFSAFASMHVNTHPLGVDVAGLEVKAFVQSKTAGIDRG